MGLYDSIMVPCPKCGYRNEFQTKSGPCELNTYQIEDAPDDAMVDVNRHAPAKCHVCDTMYSAPERPTQADILSANLTACREDLVRYRKVTSEQADELERLGAHTSSLADENARYRALVEQLTKEREDLRASVRVWMDAASDLGAQCQAKEAKLAEVERERDALRESLIHAVDLRTACHENERQLWAMRQTANYLGAPFSHDGVQTKYDQLCEKQTDVEKQRDSALSELAQVKAERDELMDTNGTLLKNASMATNELAQVKARLEVVEPVYVAAVAFHDAAEEKPTSDGDYLTDAQAAQDDLFAAIDHALSTSQPAKETK